MKKTARRAISLLLCAAILFGGAPAIFADYSAKLPDITIFKDEVNCVVYSGKGTLETINGTLPLDKTVTNRANLPSLRINTNAKSGVSGDDMLMFPVNNWGTFSLVNYYDNGYIEFDIRGEKGGEAFDLGLRSKKDGVEAERTKSTADLGVKVTKNWTHVKIPIKKIIAKNGEVSLHDMLLVVIRSNTAQKFYIADFKITSTDNEPQHDIIKINQSGYLTSGSKYAIVSCFAGAANLKNGKTFNVYSTKDSKTPVYTGKLELLSENDSKVSGEQVLLADFSSLKKAGSYYIKISRVNKSETFRISKTAYDEVLTASLGYYYYQRQGIELTEDLAGIFARQDLHPSDSKAILSSAKNTKNAATYDVSGGWYDAGDFGKYLTAGATAVSDLLLTYELFPELFADGQLSIPEAGNKVPDILDEVKYELDFFLKMQAKSGGFYDYVPSTDPNKQRYIEGISTAATADATAALAHAYIVFKDIPALKSTAKTYLAAAKKGWAYLEKNTAVKTVSGPYANYGDKAERFWAAATLFRATGDRKYEKYVLESYQLSENTAAFGRDSMSYSVNSMSLVSYFNYAMCENPDADFMSFFQAKYDGWRTHKVQVFDENPWNNALNDWAYYWGSNAVTLLISNAIYVGDRIFGYDLAKAKEIAQGSVNYVLGVNPLAFSYVSGIGKNSVKNAFSGIFSVDGIDEMPSGYMAGGANQYESRLMSSFVAKCYLDSNGEWTTNEHTIYWNSALIMSLGVLVKG